MGLEQKVNRMMHKHFQSYRFNENLISIISASRENDAYTEKIARLLNIKPTNTDIQKFANNETYVNICEGVRSRSVYLVQSMDPPLDTRIMELMFFTDAAKRASAGKVYVIYPCLPYSRQDCKTQSREPISAKVLAKLLHAVGLDKVITMDLHAAQIEGYYDDNTYIDNLPSMPLFAYFLNKCLIREGVDYVVVSPDAGGTKRAKKFAEYLNTDAGVASMLKTRRVHNEIEEQKLIGEVKNKIALIYDDILDTGGTLKNAINLLLDEGAREVYIIATHAMLNKDCIEELAEYQKKRKISGIYITDTIRPNDEKYQRIKKSGLGLNMIPLNLIFADCIARTESEDHLSPLHSYSYIEELYKDIQPKVL